MSYCVNCGVELDPTASSCPLCHTKVYNPGQPIDTVSPPPYATVKGYIEPVKAKEFTILMSIVLLTSALVCIFLNIFVIPMGQWSVYVTGICGMLWVFFLPLFFPQKSNIFINLALDGASICLFLGLISLLHPGQGWYQDIGLPTALLGTVLLEIFFLVAIHKKSSMLIKTVTAVTASAVFCVAIEIMIDLHFTGTFELRWSAIVATCVAVIDIILMTIYLREGLRSEVRRRMHF